MSDDDKITITRGGAEANPEELALWSGLLDALKPITGEHAHPDTIERFRLVMRAFQGQIADPSPERFERSLDWYKQGSLLDLTEEQFSKVLDWIIKKRETRQRYRVLLSRIELLSCASITVFAENFQEAAERALEEVEPDDWSKNVGEEVSEPKVMSVELDVDDHDFSEAVHVSERPIETQPKAWYLILSNADQPPFVAGPFADAAAREEAGREAVREGQNVILADLMPDGFFDHYDFDEEDEIV